MSTSHRPSYVALIAALRAEFNVLQLESLDIQTRQHRYDTSSLGTLAQAIRDARDVNYDPGEMVHPAVKSWLARHARGGAQYLIWSHQHRGWWKPGGHGYTGSLLEAGRFSQTETDEQLGWSSFREWLEDGRPYEVIISAPTTDEMRDVDVLLLVRDRVEQATAEAVEQRGQAVTR